MFDVVTVGGGLAGAVLARNLAELGYTVLVLESETRFKDRVRGEQMHPWGVTEARALGIYDALLNAGGNQTDRWLTYQGPMLVDDEDLVATTPHGVGSFNLSHPVMQETVIALAAEAGAEVRRGVVVEGVMPGTPASVRLADGTLVPARLVVGADGRSSRVRHWAGFTVERDPESRFIAGTVLDRCMAPEDATCMVIGAEGNALIAPFGGGRARVYFMYPAAGGRRPITGRGREDAFLAACRDLGGPTDWFADATVGGILAQFDGGDHWVTHPVSEGVVLVGDAAAASDPCYGCGQSLTLTGVRLLRDCLVSFDDWAAAAEQYAIRFGRVYGNVHAVTRWLTELRLGVGPQADALRARAAEDGVRMPDVVGLGPAALDDDQVRALVLGEPEAPRRSERRGL